jgi:hypothetical protein
VLRFDVATVQEVMMGIRFAGACLIVGSLAGCANGTASANRPTEIPGTSLAASSGLLVADTMALLDIYSSAKTPPCSEPRLARADLVEPVTNAGSGGEGSLPEGASWVELWTLDRCGAPDPYRVTFTSDGRGGTFMRVAPQ